MSADMSRVWLPELVQRIASFVPGNVIAGTLRLVDRATAALFREQQHTTVHLSAPVPFHSFAHRWDRPCNLRALTLKQRQQLLCLTARSGSIENMELLAAMPDYFLPWRHHVFAAAAAGGHLEACAWLLQRGCPWRGDTLEAAAEAGHQGVCEWLLANGCPRSDTAPARAAKAGNVSLMAWLLQQFNPDGVDAGALLTAAAMGCDLLTLQQLHRDWLEAKGRQLPSWLEGPVLENALSSPTADWQAKVEWLEGQGYDWEDYKLWGVWKQPDWRSRLDWLLQRGYSVERLDRLAHEAASAGDTEALQHLFGLGLTLPLTDHGVAISRALRGGHISAAELLWLSAGYNGEDFAEDLAPDAAHSGRVPILEWALRVLPGRVVLAPETFNQAVESGSAEALAWLREHGCPWDECTFQVAADTGSQEQLEWLAEQGCPMGVDGESYICAAGNGDVATLRCLKRLGCPLNPDVDVFTRAVRRMAFNRVWGAMPVLRWLLQQGCRVDWSAAAQAAGYWDGLRPDLQAAVEELRRELGDRADQAQMNAAQDG